MEALQVDTHSTDSRPQAVDCLIVGGGITGCSLSYELSKQGKRVVLVEQHHIGKPGASSLPVALLNPYRGRSAKASELDLAGLKAMWHLTAELSALELEPGVYKSGVLRIASNRKQAKNWQKRQGLQWLNPQQVPASYHAPFGAALFLTGGWLKPQKLLRALSNGAKHYGTKVIEHCTVTQVETVGSLHTAYTSSGPITAHNIIFCTGASVNPSLDLPELELIAGEVIALKTDTKLPYPLAGAVYAAANKGQVFVGGNHRPVGSPDPSAARQLQASAGWFIPALKTAAFTSVHSGVRAKAANNLPIVKQIKTGVWFFGALSGRGFLCSSHLSRELAQRINS